MRRIIIMLSGAVGLLIVTTFTRACLHRPFALEGITPVAIALDQDLVAKHLSAAVQFRTVSHQDPEDFEAGQFEGFIDWVKTTYPDLARTMDLDLLGGYTMLYRWAGTDSSLPPILLTSHYDVVPVIPGTEDRWRHPPFAGEIVDGVIWGRGALDDKSAVIAQLEATTALLRSGFHPARTVYLSFGHDEELGGANGAGSVASFLEDQAVQLAWSLDEGSFLFDGIFPGVGPLVAAINVAEKGNVTLNVVAKSAGGHSSLPPLHTAVGILAKAITALEANPVPGGLSGLSEQMFDTVSRYMPFGYRILFANRWLFGRVIEGQLSRVTFSNAMLRTTTAPTMLSASVKANVLPVEAVATVNFRLHPRDSIEDVVNHVKAVVRNDHVEVRLSPGSARSASTVSDWNSPGFATIERSIREVYGDVVVTPGLMTAGSDSRHYGKVADNAFRFNPMTVRQNDLTRFHGTNEKISVDTLAQGTRTYMQIIRNGASN